MRNLTFLTYSLGCRTNQAEITQIAEDLTAFGFVPVEKNPDLILINTCVVTAKAERETKRIIRHFRHLYPQAFLVVLGCGVDAKRKLKTELPEADLFVENKEKQNTVNLLVKHLCLSKSKKAFFKDKYFLSGRALLKIQDGCDRFCSFCIVPFLRGKPKSIIPKEIIQRLKELENQEIKEVILTGINLALYGRDLHPKISLLELLEEILAKTKIARISLSSIEPDIIDEKFITLFLKHERLSPYLHLALQSGSPSVLKRMGRKTDLKKLLACLLFLKQKVPEFVFRADVLVGFPQESEKEFEETTDFVKKTKISFAHIFPYSQRPKTLASLWIRKGVFEDLPGKIKKQRAKSLQSVVEKIRFQEGKKLVGKTFPCLFTQKKDSFWKALAPNSWPVKIFSKEKNLRGKIKQVKITGFKKNYLGRNQL